MDNYELTFDEVILCKNTVLIGENKDYIKLILTSKRIIFFESKVLNEDNQELKIIKLEDIKKFNGKIQVQQKNLEVYMQTIEGNFTIKFSNSKEAKKFIVNIADALTGKSAFGRETDKVKETLDTVDDVLGLNTRDVIKGVITGGLAGGITKGASVIMKKDSFAKGITKNVVSIASKTKK